MMDPKMMYSKFLLFTQEMVSEQSISDIEDEVRTYANQLMLVSEKIEKVVDLRNTVQGSVIVAHINLNGDKPNFVKRFLSEKVNDSLNPDIIVYAVYREHIICSNLKTLEWLKTILGESTALNASIDNWQKLEDDAFRKVIFLSQTRITEPFDVFLKEIKKYNPNLRVELWTCLRPVNDWKLSIKVDIHSILYLELNNRQVQVDKLIYKCYIHYIE